MQNTARIPTRRYILSNHVTMFSSLQVQAKVNDEMLDKEGWSGRRIMGFKVPEWQRPLVWSTEQSVRFIESIYLGVNIGSYMVNMTASGHPNDLVLVDGQQRLNAVQRYWNDEFPVQGDDGVLYLWSQLEPKEQAQFLRIPFAWQETNYRDDASLREAYNRHNFGGVAHSESQRA